MDIHSRCPRAIQLQTSGLDVGAGLHGKANRGGESRLPGSDEALGNEVVLGESGVANLCCRCE